MARWLKITLLTTAALLIVFGVVSYSYFKWLGMIPSHNYEDVPPDIPAFTRPAVLVFDKTNGFVHRDAIPAAKKLFMDLARQNNWDVFVTDNAAVHNPGVLDKFKLVVWNNVSGDVLTETQRQSLKSWLEAGGGWVGVHGSGGDAEYQWSWYVNELLGAQFVGHTMNPQFQDADVLVADAGNNLTAHLPAPWRVPQEEWYAFDANPRDKGYEILLTLDENSYITEGNKSGMGFRNDRMEGEHPIAWRHRIGNGRAFYSAIGHQPGTYQLPNYQQFLDQAMRWAMRDEG
jgi:type 1 glutamine amidotransferase